MGTPRPTVGCGLYVDPLPARRRVAPGGSLDRAASRGGIGLCLISNGMGRRIRCLAGRLDLPCVSKALKPLPWGVWAAMRTLHAEPSQDAIVGDQLFADVMAGRLAGIRSILVEPIRPEEEPWFTRLKRRPEQFVLARLSPEALRVTTRLPWGLTVAPRIGKMRGSATDGRNAGGNFRPPRRVCIVSLL